MDKVIINGKEFGCYGYNAFSENDLEKLYFVIADEDYPEVKKLIESIEKIEIKDARDATLIETSKFGTYESIYFQDKSSNIYYNDKDVAIDSFVITLKAKDLAARVEEIAAMVSPEFDESTMSIEDLKEYRKSLLFDECKKAIASPFTAKTTYGDEEFQLDENEQKLLYHLFVNAAMTNSVQYYHSSTDNIPREYSADDIISIYTSFSNHELSHLYRYDLLAADIDATFIREDIRAVNYNDELRVDQKSAIDGIISARKSTLEKMIAALKG